MSFTQETSCVYFILHISLHFSSETNQAKRGTSGVSKFKVIVSQVPYLYCSILCNPPLLKLIKDSCRISIRELLSNISTHSVKCSSLWHIRNASPWIVSPFHPHFHQNCSHSLQQKKYPHFIFFPLHQHHPQNWFLCPWCIIP